MSQAIFRNRLRLKTFEEFLPPDMWYQAIGGMLKQGVERLDNVRAVAGEQLMHLVWNTDIRNHASGPWALPWLKKLELAFPLLVYAGSLKLTCGTYCNVHSDQVVPWNVGEWLFPRIPPLLDIAAYRKVLLSGIITSLASRNESAVSLLACLELKLAHLY